MDALDAVFTRRSVRQYTDEPVSDQAIETILRAAMQSPSAANMQPWHFVVINDRRLLDRIPDFHPYSSFLREASVAIVVCGDLERDRLLDASYWVQGCSAATQNLLRRLTRSASEPSGWVYTREGNGSKACTVFYSSRTTWSPSNIVSLGHPAEPPAQVDRFDPSRVSRNIWPGAGDLS